MKLYLSVLPSLLLLLILAPRAARAAPTATPTPPGQPAPTVAVATATPATGPSGSSKPVILTDANFQAVISGPKPVLVFFWAAWCNPCKRMSPDIEQLARDFQGQAVVGKLDTDENQETPSTFAVSSIPMVLIFKDGEPVDRLAGVKSSAVLRQHLKQQINASPAKTKTPPSAPHRGSGKPITLTDANFQAVISGPDPVLVFFWAAWCSPCRRMAPIVDDVAQAMSDKLIVGKLNVDENQETANAFADMTLPTLLLFKQGEQVDRIVGFQPKEKLLKRLGAQINSGQ